MEVAFERIEVLEGVLLTPVGARVALLSRDDADGCLTYADAFDAVDGTRERLILGETAFVVLVLTVDTVDVVDTTLDRTPEVGVTSDFAVSNVVEPSLVEDIVDGGRERLDGGRNVEGPAVLLRIVEA